MYDFLKLFFFFYNGHIFYTLGCVFIHVWKFALSVIGFLSWYLNVILKFSWTLS